MSPGRRDINLKLPFMLALLMAPLAARAVGPTTAFWKHRSSGPSLKYTTSSQTILAGLCSGVVTVGTYDASGTLTAVGSNLTVSLAGSGTTTYYSDSNCTTSITSVTITTGNSTQNFYFVDSANETLAVVSSATGYTSGTQSQTISTNGFVWTGGGANSLWATGGNWSGGSAPGSSDIAVFNSTCSSNCSPTLGANISIGGIRMDTGYSGTFTQSSSYTITTSTSGWVQRAGTFTGSSSGGAISIGGHFILSGGTFTSTSGTLTQTRLGGSLDFKVTGSPTFNHNSGSIVLTSSGYVAHNITPGTVTYNNVTMTGYSDVFDLGGGTMTIAGNLSYGTDTATQINNGTLAAAGNVTVGAGSLNYATVVVKVTGRAAGSTITVAAGGYVNSLEIAAGTNNVTLSGTVTTAGPYTLTSVGTLTTTGSTLVLAGTGYGIVNIKPGTAAYNNVQFTGYVGGFDFQGGTMTVNGNLVIGNGLGGGNDGGTFNNGTLNVAGNVTTNSSDANGVTGSLLVKLVGNASGQTVTSSATNYNGVPNLEIAAGANNVTLSGTVWDYGTYKVTSVGTLTTTGSTLKFMNTGASTITPGSATYNDVKFHETWLGSTYTLVGTFNIGGNLTLNSTQGYAITVNSGTLSLAKNFTSSGSASSGGTAAVTFVGTADQTVTSTGGGTFPTGAVTLSTTGSNKLLLGSAVTFAGTLTETSGGGITMGGYNFTLGGLALGGKTITKGGGTLIVNGTTVGTGSLYGGTVSP